MTVKRSFGIFDLNEIKIGRAILPLALEKCLGAIPYLYEAIGGEAPPNNGSQELAGHDHAELGGRPIPRGGCLTLSGGENPLWTIQPDPNAVWQQFDVSSTPARDDNSDTLPSKSAGGSLFAYASPGIDTQQSRVYHDCRFWVHWPSDAEGNARIRVRNGSLRTMNPWTPIEVTVESEPIQPSDDLQEVVLRLPVGNPAAYTYGDYWQQLFIEVKRETKVSGTTEDFRIFRVSIHETEQLSKPASKGRLRFQ